jgi:hypothetical protein
MQNRNLQNSLRCLQHPATWISIALLLINDHVLKNIYPSWFTGKLSDFAGIFFFPFIMAAGLSIFLVNSNLTTRQIGQIAFGFVASWFILLKTFEPANHITAHIASLLVGFSTKFSLDPTDLFSLIMLIPAWAMWEQVNFKKPNRFAYAMLVLGSFAAIATSPPYFGITTVTNLEYYKDGITYAADREVPTDDENYYPVAKSLDGGLTWEEAPEVRNIEERGLPIKHCSHLYPDICYQLTKSGKLQELSNDDTWIDVKELEIKTTYETFRIEVYDLILFEWAEKEYVIIAIGEYGIRRRELPDGEWDEISVLGADE